MLISNSIAESAVKDVVTLRCAKKTADAVDRPKCTLLVQVRLVVLNGKLKMRDMRDLRHLSSDGKREVRCQRFA